MIGHGVYQSKQSTGRDALLQVIEHTNQQTHHANSGAGGSGLASAVSVFPARYSSSSEDYGRYWSLTPFETLLTPFQPSRAHGDEMAHHAPGRTKLLAAKFSKEATRRPTRHRRSAQRNGLGWRAFCRHPELGRQVSIRFH